MAQSTKLWDRFFEDKHGKLVIFQKPNKPIIIAFVGSFFALLTVAGIFHILTTYIAFTAWLTWSLLELVKGRSYFRRTIGALVLIFTILILWWQY